MGAKETRGKTGGKSKNYKLTPYQKQVWDELDIHRYKFSLWMSTTEYCLVKEELKSQSGIWAFTHSLTALKRRIGGKNNEYGQQKYWFNRQQFWILDKVGVDKKGIKKFKHISPELWKIMQKVKAANERRRLVGIPRLIAES